MSAPVSPDSGQQPFILDPDVRPSVEHLVIDVNEPSDIYSVRQRWLLVSPLYASWSGPGDGRSFLALANVGLFFSVNRPPVVPDALLSLDVGVPADLHVKKNRSYFIWEFGKAPDVVSEVVSNDEGGELDHKLREYAQIGIPYYVVWDPFNFLKRGPLHAFVLRSRTYEPLDKAWFPDVGLGVTVWHGKFEDAEDDWLRCCDANGVVLATGEERAAMAEQGAEQEKQRAEQAIERAERLAAQLRNLGVHPGNGDA